MHSSLGYLGPSSSSMRLSSVPVSTANLFCPTLLFALALSFQSAVYGSFDVSQKPSLIIFCDSCSDDEKTKLRNDLEKVAKTEISKCRDEPNMLFFIALTNAEDVYTIKKCCKLADKRSFYLFYLSFYFKLV